MLCPTKEGYDREPVSWPARTPNATLPPGDRPSQTRSQALTALQPDEANLSNVLNHLRFGHSGPSPPEQHLFARPTFLLLQGLHFRDTPSETVEGSATTASYQSL